MCSRLLSASLTRRQVEILACHLTVGETYFFREKKSFGVLEERIFPELMRACARRSTIACLECGLLHRRRALFHRHTP